MMRNALGVFLFMTSIPVIADAAEVEVSLWPKGKVESLPGVVAVQDHPCGAIARVRLSRLPPLDSKALKPERVVEIDETGKVIRRWATPVDTYPVALDGTDLIVGFNNRIYYKVAIDREIRLLEHWSPPESSFERESRTCPNLPEFGKSAYIQCWPYFDSKSRRERVLAFEGVCS